uniref:Zinc finger CCCH domain-containing protein 13 n=1 Tax=Anthurium amnicola TaxID=1678845 RepID=A0A1D1XVB5_9ARAE
MLERKLYKTKLCILYQRGRCARQSCTFAHGEAELRRFGDSSNGRRDFRGGDLRDKLDRGYSPRREYSPARDGRRHHVFQSNKFGPHDRGYSSSRSPVARRHGKKKQTDGQSDVSGSHKISDSGEDRPKKGKVSSYDDTDVLEEQLKHAQLDIELLDDQKHQLETFFEAKIQEVDKLSAKVEELETQLDKEQEDCKRFTSKIKRFIKAHRRYLRAQEDLKRSQIRLQRLGDQFGTENSRPSNNGEDSSINAISDGGPNGDGCLSPRHEMHNHTSPIKRKQRLESAAAEEAKLGNVRKRERYMGMSIRQQKPSQIETPTPLSENKSKETETTNMNFSKKDIHKYSGDEHEQKYERNSSLVAKYEDDDEEVDVDGVDVDLRDPNGNCEVEIE